MKTVVADIEKVSKLAEEAVEAVEVDAQDAGDFEHFELGQALALASMAKSQAIIAAVLLAWVQRDLRPPGGNGRGRGNGVHVN